MSMQFIASRILVGGGAIVEVAPRNYGKQFTVKHVAGERENFMILRDWVKESIVDQHINVLGEVNGRQPYGDRVIFLGFGDDLADDNRLRWPNTMREIGKAVAISLATVRETAHGTIPGKAIMSYPTHDGIPQPLYNEHGKANRVALLSNKNGRISTIFATPSGKGSYTIKDGTERENQDLLPSVIIDEVEYPLGAEVLAHLMQDGYLVVAPTRAQGLIEAQFKLTTLALNEDLVGWECAREDYRQRRLAAEQERGIYRYELSQDLLDEAAK